MGGGRGSGRGAGRGSGFWGFGDEVGGGGPRLMGAVEFFAEPPA